MSCIQIIFSTLHCSLQRLFSRVFTESLDSLLDSLKRISGFIIQMSSLSVNPLRRGGTRLAEATAELTAEPTADLTAESGH